MMHTLEGELSAHYLPMQSPHYTPTHVAEEVPGEDLAKMASDLAENLICSCGSNFEMPIASIDLKVSNRIKSHRHVFKGDIPNEANKAFFLEVLVEST